MAAVLVTLVIMVDELAAQAGAVAALSDRATAALAGRADDRELHGVVNTLRWLTDCSKPGAQVLSPVTVDVRRPEPEHIAEEMATAQARRRYASLPETRAYLDGVLMTLNWYWNGTEPPRVA